MRREAKLVKNKSYIMNLYDQLKPELKKELEKDKEIYPISVGGIINVLKEKEFVVELTVGEVGDLIRSLPSISFDINEIYKAFNK
jgi:hypothetical protein